MHSNSTAHALIQLRGPTITYGHLKLRPEVDSRAHSIDVTGFTVRKNNDRYTLQDLPVSQVLTRAAKEDIVLFTFELDEDERYAYLEIDFEIPEYDEVERMHFRVVEYEALPERLIYEVEDDSGDWLPIEDVIFAELLSQSFLRTLEISAVEKLDSHNLDRLPMEYDS